MSGETTCSNKSKCTRYRELESALAAKDAEQVGIVERCARIADGSKTNAGVYIAQAIRSLPAQAEVKGDRGEPDPTCPHCVALGMVDASPQVAGEREDAEYSACLWLLQNVAWGSEHTTLTSVHKMILENIAARAQGRGDE